MDIDLSEPIDIELGKAYGIYSDTGGVYEVNFYIYEDYEYKQECREYQLFGEERCDDFSFLSWAEVWVGEDFSNEHAVIAKMEAHYDRERDIIVAEFDGERREFSPGDDIGKEWAKYRAEKVKPLLNLKAAIEFFKKESCCNEKWTLFTDKREAEKASWGHKLFIAQVHAAASELGEDPDEIMYQLGLL